MLLLPPTLSALFTSQEDGQEVVYVARGDDSRMRSATTPVSNDHTNERGSEAEEEEVFYVDQCSYIMMVERTCIRM